MRETRLLAHARRAAALQAAQEKVARADLAVATLQSRARVDTAERARAAHNERLAQWRDAMIGAHLDVTRIIAHGHAVALAQQTSTGADADRDTARQQENEQAALLCLAIARSRLSDGHAKRLARRLAKRWGERAMAEFEALTLSRWSRP
jgi:hypothetical protein